jgi:hypothetical protein
MGAFEEFAAMFDDEDDPDLWRAALQYILAEIEQRPGVSIEVGHCSHWLRPHQARWTADGGFAWPTGYGGGGGDQSRSALPQFDWSVVLGWDGAEWNVVERQPLRITLRLAIPSRTRRHLQAAVHALWHTGREKEVVFYGFRKRSDGWAFTAST